MCLRREIHGLTLVELLIAITTIGLLIAILLPAVAASRESARRTACGNNLRQLGLALISYHSSHHTLPCAVIWSPIGEPLGGGLYPIGVIDRVARSGDTSQDTIYANWLLSLLAYFGETSLAGVYRPDLPISHPDNRSVRTAELPVLKCSSDPASQAGRVYQRGLAAGLSENQYTRGNYAINVGPDAYCLKGQSYGDTVCVAGFIAWGTDLEQNNRAVWGSGIAGANKSFPFSAVTDGLSNTVAVDEVRSGIHPLDLRGAWALGQIGASALARHGRFTISGRPNPGGVFDQIIGCGRLIQEVGAATLHRARMPCQPDLASAEVNTLSAARSYHPGGVMSLYVDGSAHWMGDMIDVDVWHELHTRSTSRE